MLQGKDGKGTDVWDVVYVERRKKNPPCPQAIHTREYNSVIQALTRKTIEAYLPSVLEKISWIVTDITELRKAEEARKDMEQRYQAVVDNARIGISVLNPKMEIVAINKELKRYSERIRQEGYDNTRYLVDMNLKIAFPFISFIMVLVGIPIALGIKKGGTPLAVSVGIGGCFLYMITLSLSRSLGLSGIFPPALSASAANLVFFFFGLYLMMSIER